MQPGRLRAAKGFIFVTVVLDVLALGMVIPVLPKLVLDFMHGDTARAASMYGTFNVVWAFAQFVCAPIMGALSDRFGRRGVILLSCFGLSADYLLMALAPSLGWLLVGRVISGMTAANTTTAGAYIADVTDAAGRAAGFGLIGAAWGMGFILGPAFGGLLGTFGPRVPFWAAAVLALCNALYGLLVLPESLPPERRSTRFPWRRANPLGALVLLKSQPQLLAMTGVYVLYLLAHQVLPSCWALYAGYRYHWDTGRLGLSLGAVGLGNVLSQAVLVKRAVRAWGERVTAALGLFAGTCGFAVMGLAPTGALFLASIPGLALMGFFGPSSQSLMSRRVGVDEQGRLQGAISSLMGLCGVAGPRLFTDTFAWSIDARHVLHAPGAPFLLSAVFTAAALAGLLIYVARDPAVTATTASPAAP